jgi:hypothetical protein
VPGAPAVLGPVAGTGPDVVAVVGRQTDAIVLASLWIILTVFAWVERVRNRDRLSRLEEALRERA